MNLANQVQFTKIYPTKISHFERMHGRHSSRARDVPAACVLTVEISRMSIYKYFSKKPKATGVALPSPNEVQKVLPTTVLAINKEVEKVVAGSTSEEKSAVTGKRGPYVKLTASQKALVRRRAAEHGVTSALHHFKTRNSEFDLKETTVRRLKKEYLTELKKRKRDEVSEPVVELPSKKRGRPTLLSTQMEEEIRAYISVLRENGSVVNTAITIASARGVVLSHDASSLATNGGHIDLSKD